MTTVKNKLKATLLITTIAAIHANITFASPYIGAALGVNTMTSTSGSYFRSVPVDFFAGYGTSINTNLYLGGEINLTPFTSTLSKSAGSSLRTTYNYGVSILPGVMFSDNTVGYVRAGVTRSHFSSIGGNKTGTQFGLGLQTNVTQDLDLRTEYVYTLYSKIASSASPKSDAFKLGLIYKFE